MFFWRVYEYSFVFGWFSRKRDEIMKIWANYGVLRCGMGIPTQQRRPMPRGGMSTPRPGSEGGFGQPRVRRGVAMLRCGKGLRHSVVVLCHTTWKILVFCFVFVFPLLRGLLYWTNEDHISV